MSLWPACNVRARLSLEHQALDASFSRGLAQRRELLPGRGVNGSAAYQRRRVDRPAGADVMQRMVGEVVRAVAYSLIRQEVGDVVGADPARVGS